MSNITENILKNKELSDLYLCYSDEFLKVYKQAFEKETVPCRINEFGIIDEQRYDSKTAVLVIGKETNGWDNEEFEKKEFFRKWLREISREKKIKNTPIMWYNLGRWLMAIKNPDRDIQDICNQKSEALYMLGTMAFTNINKVRGKNRSGKAYRKVADSDVAGKLLRREVDIINPKIIICLATADKVDKHIGFKTLESKGIKVIKMPHPASRKKKTDMLQQLISQL